MKKYIELKEAEQKLLQGAEQKLLQKLEQEKTAGIPSIPESLKPDNIGQLLERKPEKETLQAGINWKRFSVASGGMVAIAAMLFIICIPRLAMGGGSTADCANGAAVEMMQDAMVETKAASAAVAGEAEAEFRPTECSDQGGSVTPENSASVTQEQDKGAETEEGALEFMPQFDGDYVAACVEGETLYMLQKTASYELYIVNLTNTSDWKKINLEIPDEEVIIKLEWKMDELYAVTEQGKEYACPMEN